MSGRYCAIFLTFAAFANVANPEEGSWTIRDKREDVENEGNLKIRLIRATSSKLIIEALCDPSCEDIKWDIMALRYYAKWTSVSPRDVQDQGNGKYVIKHLHPSFDYVVQARIPGSFDRIRAKTCRDFLGSVRDLHSPTSGPGWLDIRWKPFSTIECLQNIKYLTRYRVGDGNFTQYREYGFYPIDDKGNIQVGPSHPCDDWPNLFCLLITEGVEAGKKHTVEILPQRIDGGDGFDVGIAKEIVVIADPHNRQGAPDGGVHPDCQMWAWLAVGASLFCIFVIVGILVSALVTTIRKDEAYEKEHGLPEGPIDFMAMLYH